MTAISLLLPSGLAAIGGPERVGRSRPRRRPDPAQPEGHRDRDRPTGTDGYVSREVLDVEPASSWDPRRWLGVAVLLVAVLVVVLGAAGWSVDRQDRASETRAMAACRRDLNEAVALSNLRLLSMADVLAPLLYQTSGARHDRIADEMAQPARRVLPDVERADRVCRAVSVRPWHLSLVGQRRTETAYSGALVTRIQAVARRGGTYFRNNAALHHLEDAAEAAS